MISRVPGIAERLVLHRRDLALVAERHRRQTAGGVKRLELAERRSNFTGSRSDSAFTCVRLPSRSTHDSVV